MPACPHPEAATGPRPASTTGEGSSGIASSTRPSGVRTRALPLQFRSGCERGAGPVSQAPGEVSRGPSTATNAPPDSSYGALGRSADNGGRPPGGDVDGEGYSVCPSCEKDFFVRVPVRGDHVVGVAPDSERPGYID